MFALDTNILVYAEGMGDDRRTSLARLAVRKLPADEMVVAAQVLVEFFRVLVVKGRRPPREARALMRDWEGMAFVAPTTASALWRGADLAADHGLQIFDAVLLAASAEAGCRLLLSEDMQDGFVWRGVTVANPFAETLHPLLADALNH